MPSQIRFQQNGPSGPPAAGTDLVTVDVNDLVNVTNSAGVTLPVGLPLCVDLATQAITAAATQAVFAVAYFIQLFAKFTLGAGAGAYTLNLELPVVIGELAPQAGQTVEINLEFAASANPTVVIFDTNTGGTNLTGNIANPAPANPAYWYGKFKFGQDGHWHLITNNWN